MLMKMSVNMWIGIAITAFIVFNIEARNIPISKRAAFYIANDTVCNVDGFLYENGDIIPTDNPCETCKCRPPGFACVLKECDLKPHCKAIRREGHCCPDYHCAGCEHEGIFYADGQVVPNPDSPCYTCYCQGSSIACSLVSCKFRSDCEPRYAAGECCPRYDHCEGETSTAKPTVAQGSTPARTSQLPTTFFQSTTQRDRRPTTQYHPSTTPVPDFTQVTRGETGFQPSIQVSGFIVPVTSPHTIFTTETPVTNAKTAASNLTTQNVPEITTEYSTSTTPLATNAPTTLSNNLPTVNTESNTVSDEEGRNEVIPQQPVINEDTKKPQHPPAILSQISTTTEFPATKDLDSDESGEDSSKDKTTTANIISNTQSEHVFHASATSGVSTIVPIEKITTPTPTATTSAATTATPVPLITDQTLTTTTNIKIDPKETVSENIPQTTVASQETTSEPCTTQDQKPTTEFIPAIISTITQPDFNTDTKQSQATNNVAALERSNIDTKEAVVTTTISSVSESKPQDQTTIVAPTTISRETTTEKQIAITGVTPEISSPRAISKLEQTTTPISPEPESITQKEIDRSTQSPIIIAPSNEASQAVLKPSDVDKIINGDVPKSNQAPTTTKSPETTQKIQTSSAPVTTQETIYSPVTQTTSFKHNTILTQSPEEPFITLKETIRPATEPPAPQPTTNTQPQSTITTQAQESITTTATPPTQQADITPLVLPQNDQAPVAAQVIPKTPQPAALQAAEGIKDSNVKKGASFESQQPSVLPSLLSSKNVTSQHQARQTTDDTGGLIDGLRQVMESVTQLRNNISASIDEEYPPEAEPKKLHNSPTHLSYTTLKQPTKATTLAVQASEQTSQSVTTIAPEITTKLTTFEAITTPPPTCNLTAHLGNLLSQLSQRTGSKDPLLDFITRAIISHTATHPEDKPPQGMKLPSSDLQKSEVAQTSTVLPVSNQSKAIS